MLWSLTFNRLGLVMGDLYFIDPNLDQGTDGAERGVRVELRLFERDDLKGSVYSAVPIRIDRPIWRIDLLETVDSKPGSLNRAHHHPRFQGWEPGRRVFDAELSADPVRWVHCRISDLDSVLDYAGVDRSELDEGDVEQMKEAAPMIVSTLEHLLSEVAAGRAGLAPDESAEFVRASWL